METRRWRVMQTELTYDQACGLCALGSRIIWRFVGKQGKVRTTNKLCDLKNAKDCGVRVFYEYVWEDI